MKMAVTFAQEPAQAIIGKHSSHIAMVLAFIFIALPSRGDPLHRGPVQDAAAHSEKRLVRGDVYCRSQMGLNFDASLDTSNGSIVARCDSMQDVPILGTCSGPVGDSSELAAARNIINDPIDCDEGAADRPGWQCAWDSSEPLDLSSASASICCVRW